MGLTNTTNYAGELLDGIIAKARTGMESVQGGHLNVIDNVVANPFIHRVSASNIFQERAATPVTSGDVTLDEKKITLGDLMVYTEVNPKSFEQYWRKYQPEGQMNFRGLPLEIQRAMTEEILRVVAEEMETKIWQGDTSTTGVLKYFDGFIKQLEADASVIDVASPVSLTNANLNQKLGAVYSAAPQAVRRKQSFKYYMNDNSFTLFMEQNEALANKGKTVHDSADPRFRNRQIVVSAGIPDDTIIGAVGNIGMDSNLHFAIDWDMTSINQLALFERKQANSEVHFIKMLFKAGVGYGWGEQVVLYKA